MKHLKKLLAALTVFGLPLFAQQSTEAILIEIENNNTSLMALRKSADAQKIGNKTDIFLQNPELEFGYLWGNPSVIGNRTDFSIKQSFDFPTAYGYRNQISNLKNAQTELEYQKQQKAMQLEARLICIDLTYTNAMKSTLSKRMIDAQRIAKSYKIKFDVGETNVLEFNKAQLNLLNLGSQWESLEIESNSLLSNLARLNGGKPVDFGDSTFQELIIPANFEQWYGLAEQNNPLLAWLKQEIEINQKQQKLNSAMALPKFQTGYMSENVVGQKFQGVTVGLSIPLWENKNKGRFAKANTLALESIWADNKLKFYMELKTLHSKTLALQKNVNAYRSGLGMANNSQLLAKALEKGEIALINYLTELSFYYESTNRMLELERDMNKTLAKLNQYK